jgi:serine/threonine-protein kinase
MTSGPPPQGVSGQDDPLVGSMIGPYRVLRRVGEGGMGVVYQAEHQEIGQVAAIKVLSEPCARDPQFLRRFSNEARAVSRVRHAGMVHIFDFGTTERGTPYILMEFLQGELLRARLDRLRGAGKQLDVNEAVRLARQTASALAAAHRKGIVHRDLKPDNLMLIADDAAARGERVKLLDFGIARFLEESNHATLPGVAIGTPTYMSPEQCTGEESVDASSDVYSLGVMLYEMLAGRPPFRGSDTAVMRMHLFKDPLPIVELVPSLPPALVELVHGMLAKPPAQRPWMGRPQERRGAQESGARGAPGGGGGGLWVDI